MGHNIIYMTIKDAVHIKTLKNMAENIMVIGYRFPSSNNLFQLGYTIASKWVSAINVE